MKRIMKKILKYSLLAVLGFVLAANTGCKKSELDTDQFNGFSLAAVSPNPVMRGAELRMVGAGLENVTEVRLAGDVIITDITVVKSGAQSEIRVMVPLEGPEVGKVTVVSNDGRSASTRFDLTFTEPIVIESFSPDVVWSGDVLTFKGEYLNDVKTVIFAGDVMVGDFVSQSRHELSVKVPGNIITGQVILSDVDELTDETTIPNHIYTAEELGVGAPVVDAIEDKPTVKAGQIVTVTGEHLDMIQTVDMPNAEDIYFELNAEATEMKFVMPASALSGKLMMASYDGDIYEVGEIDVVVVKDLTVTAAEGRFKGGYKVEITGSDLDLVTKVEFGGNVEADFYYTDGTIITNLPFAAKDGPVTVTMESGAQAFSDDIEVVKPLIASSTTEGVAGKTEIIIVGADLDLVTSAKIGTKEQGFIDSEFAVEFDENIEEFYVVVKLPAQAYTAPITLTSDAGYETATDVITVTYDEAVSITFDKKSYELGEVITFSGENLLKIEQIYVKGKKVTNFLVRTDNAMGFVLPDKVGPGFYRLDLVLVDGTELTWAFPFQVTAPFTETTIWEGSSTVTWDGGAVTALSWGGYDWSKVEEGTVLAAYYTIDDPNGCIRFGNGSWASMPSLAGLAPEGNLPLAEGGYQFELTAADLVQLQTAGGLVVCGTGYTINRISLIVFGGESKTVIWEGSHAIDWGGSDEAHKALTTLSWGGYDWSTVAEGTTLALSFERDADEVQIRLGNGSWAALPGTDDPFKPEGTELRVELTAAMIAEMVANGGLVITGQGYTITEVALVTSGGPAGKAIWEGSHAIDWGGSDEAHKALTALSWGGYDWSTVEAGTTLALEFDRDADEVQIRLGNGSWAALPGTEDPFKPEGTSLEVELTADMIAEMVANGGLVITGQGYTLTAVILK